MEIAIGLSAAAILVGLASVTPNNRDPESNDDTPAIKLAQKAGAFVGLAYSCGLDQRDIDYFAVRLAEPIKDRALSDQDHKKAIALFQATAKVVYRHVGGSIPCEVVQSTLPEVRHRGSRNC